MNAPDPSTNADGVAADDWESHWNDYGDSAEDNPAQQYRRKLLFDALGPLGANTRLLDIGSGQGDLLAEARRRAPATELFGVEYSAEGIRQGATKVDARFIERNLLVDADISAGDRGWATHATCSEVIEHVDDSALLLRNAAAYLAPGCRVVVTVPGGPRSAFDKHIGHRRHFTADALRAVLEDAGYDVVEVRRAGFPVFNVYKLLVILRGKKLIDDARAHSASRDSGLARIVTRAFRTLFRFALPDTPWGWQLVAIAMPRSQ